MPTPPTPIRTPAKPRPADPPVPRKGPKTAAAG